VRILVVEDDELLAMGLTRLLSRGGHSVCEAITGKHADTLLVAEEFDLVVLDLGLPDLDGFEVLRRMRARHSPASVLVLTARDAVDERVRGLDLGADDYLTKPFSVNEFESRVRALWRRAIAPFARWAIGSMTIDFATKRVRVREQPIDLTPREWGLLEMFLTHQGRVLSKDQLADGLYASEEQLSPNAIEAHVSRLRNKIARAGVHVRTVRGFGYLLEVPNE